MNGAAETVYRRLGCVAAAVLLVLLVAVASPSGGALAPVVGPVAVANAAASAPVRQLALCVEAPCAGAKVPAVRLPSPLPVQRSVLEWGLPPPRAPDC